MMMLKTLELDKKIIK